MFDLKTINTVVRELEEERGIPKDKTLEAIAMAFATAYKREYGKKGQIIRASFDNASGQVEFWQVKIVVDREQVIMEGDEEMGHEDLKAADVDDIKIRFNPEQHMLIEDAKKIKRDAQVGDELVFPLEAKADFGRIAAQTAKQVIIQKIREAEKVSVMGEYGEKEGEVVAGTVERVERGVAGGDHVGVERHAHIVVRAKQDRVLAADHRLGRALHFVHHDRERIAHAGRQQRVAFGDEAVELRHEIAFGGDGRRLGGEGVGSGGGFGHSKDSMSLECVVLACRSP